LSSAKDAFDFAQCDAAVELDGRGVESRLLAAKAAIAIGALTLIETVAEVLVRGVTGKEHLAPPAINQSIEVDADAFGHAVAP
jgi:hypothetical protein